MEIHEYTDSKRRSLFGKWFNALDAVAAAKVTTALYRLKQGHTLNIKSLGEGIFEYKIDFGPGYRIYFGQESKNWVLLLGGGTKKRQNKDIKTAKNCWKVYKMLKG